MDAARLALAATFLLSWSSGGCALLNPPATQRSPEPPPDDSSQIVQQAPTKSSAAHATTAAEPEQADPLDAQIAAYLERMEAAERAGSRRAAAPGAEQAGGLRLATDARVVPESPARPSAVIAPPSVADFGARTAAPRPEVDAVPLGPRSAPPGGSADLDARGGAGTSRSALAREAGGVAPLPASAEGVAASSERPVSVGAPAPSSFASTSSNSPTAAAPTAPLEATPPVAPVAPQKPTLTALSARSAAAVVEPAPGVAAAAAGVNTPVAASGAPASLQEFVGHWLATSDDGSFRHQLDARVMQVLAGEYERAREPLNLVTKEQQETASRFIDALVAIREGHLGDPGGAARNVLRELDALATTLRQVSELSVSTPVLCREVRGFGQYTPIEPAEFRGGAEFVIYVEVRDFASTKEPDGVFLSRFDLRTTVLSKNGENILELHDDDLVDRCRNQRKDCFLPKLVRLPTTLSPGEYVARVSVVDKVGEKAAEQQAAFRVLAR